MLHYIVHTFNAGCLHSSSKKDQLLSNNLLKLNLSRFEAYLKISGISPYI